MTIWSQIILYTADNLQVRGTTELLTFVPLCKFMQQK